ncbi:uncharacterized protein L969DRAFT_88130 [Mixia osmundae IAM 14324]|uniref:Protein kinase domain-containing protein n=1 Tax=Mixia osmundae (strain CBS 9802 / IAM 14324 / JCM 22182 / KY 12970) TaxID=764103 RepID=G7E148_MIXOS|nr:uncharacterized protein L969DRAFT_88130 [Mixia osmundae IAM 14324]KEI38802.1 hypothetical protein L969DRAFT_88130 [Mixia osmundae IAM 14324]GAA96558.1 hypothetical protein E5Q_03227 [Mixia osmundae IAM 14324]
MTNDSESDEHETSGDEEHGQSSDGRARRRPMTLSRLPSDAIASGSETDADAESTEHEPAKSEQSNANGTHTNGRIPSLQLSKDGTESPEQVVMSPATEEPPLMASEPQEMEQTPTQLAQEPEELDDTPPKTMNPPGRSATTSPTSAKESLKAALSSAKNRAASEASSPEGFKRHRRTSSMEPGVKETLDARHEDLGDGSRRINQYVLGKEIGHGSFGSVCVAQDEQGRSWAVKEFSKMRLRKRAQSEMMRAQRGRKRPSQGTQSTQGSMTAHARPPVENGNSNDEDPLLLIRHEIAVMKKLTHPNLVRLHEVLDVNERDSLYMVVELCEGGSLMNLSIKEEVQAYDETTARNYFRQILLAVEYLHSNDIVHRDIKPDNILLATKDREVCKLADFGVSEMFHKGTDLSKQNVGSPAFLSPELCVSQHGEIHVKAADVWAMGVTLYCLVCGRLPFATHNPLELYEMIKNDPVKLPKELGDDLKDVLKKLLDKCPKRRITIEQLRVHPWITESEQSPLPSKEDNCEALPETTDADLASAFIYIGRAKRVANKFRQLVSERRTKSSSFSQNDGEGSDLTKDSGSSTSLSSLMSSMRSMTSTLTESSIGEEN